MTSLSVTADETARRDGDVDVVVASLPVSLSFGDAAADLAAVSGTPGWATRAAQAFGHGARGVLVVEPCIESASALAALRDAAGDRSVVIDRALAGHPSLAELGPSASEVDGSALLEVRVIRPEIDDPTTVLLEQLALVRAIGGAIGGAVASVRSVHRHSRGFSIRGRLTDGRPVLLTATVSTVLPAGATVRLLGARHEVSMEIDAGRAARPARATVTTVEGRTTLPTRFETAHRNTWRRLVEAVSEGTPQSDLDAIAQDIEIATVVAGTP